MLLEPARRDSGPAIVAGSAFAQMRDGNAVVLALAADHVVLDTAAFVAACREGLGATEVGRIVTFGVEPERPATEYGYIRPGEPISGNSYDKKHPAKNQLPRTLMEAAGRLKASKASRALFGDAFVDHYSATREWEEREFRKAITEWELDRYMEII